MTAVIILALEELCPAPLGGAVDVLRRERAARAAGNIPKPIDFAAVARDVLPTCTCIWANTGDVDALTCEIDPECPVHGAPR